MTAQCAIKGHVSRDAIIESLGMSLSSIDGKRTDANSNASKDVRIQKALKAAQRMEYFCNTPQSTFDLDKLPKWTSADDKTSPGFTSKDYFGQTNMHEKARMASGFGLLSAFGLPNPSTRLFGEFRQTLMAIATAHEQCLPGHRCLTVQNETQSNGFFMRIADIRTLTLKNDQSKTDKSDNAFKCPLLVVLYQFHTEDSMPRGVSNASRLLCKASTGKMVHVRSDNDELHMLLQLLQHNTSLLSSGFNIPRWPEEKDCLLSFIMPCMPLNSLQMSRLQFNYPCGSCGKEATLICGACGLVRFCSQACQVARWPVHKKDCKEAHDAPHYTVAVVEHHQALRQSSKATNDEVVYFGYNHMDTAVDMAYKGVVSTIFAGAGKPLVPAFAVGNKLFMVKLQCTVIAPKRGDTGELDLYNPEMTVRCSVMPDQPGYAHIVRLMRLYGREGIRLFMYAERVDDKTLKLYHTYLPRQDTRW